jgi:hypothetical protein
MKRAILLVAVGLLISSVAECAPQATPTPAPPRNPQLVAGSSQMPPAIKGAPFTAKQISELKGTLRDGTNVDRIDTYTRSRDSEGRTRTESDTSVLIRDPVARVIYELNKTTHVATVPPVSSATQDQIREAAQAALEAAQARKITRESLGTKMMEGLMVEGTRTIEIGTFAGLETDPVIKIVEEHWYSPELKMDIMTSRDDPRQTTMSIYRLTDIQRSEPDPALFQLPPDYTVRDQNKKREEMQ